ncbi:MAG: hypothetical protein AAF587_01490 [Bacteroidota bacterium]
MPNRLHLLNHQIVSFIIRGGAICLLGGLFLYLPQKLPPAEDATILFRYSQHLASEGIIGYNPGGPPVEGATDFLWMLLLTGGIKLGLDPYHTAGILSFLGIIGTYFFSHKWIFQDASTHWPSSLFLLSLAVNSQLIAASQGFSIAFWGAWFSACWYFFWKNSLKSLLISTLLLALIRPDGLIIGVPLVGMLLWNQRQDWRSTLPLLLYWAILPGLVYFLWRWQYFGTFLPLPMYVKGGTGLVAGSVLYEFKYLMKYLFPLLLGIAYFLWQYPNSRKIYWPLICSGIIAPLLFYALIHLEQNIADRFMYPIHLCTLSTFFLSWQKSTATAKKGLMQVLWGLYILLSFLYFLVFLKGDWERLNNTPIHIAQELNAFPDHRMAVTEAGYLPYYSEWNSLDLWGLNTPQLARRLVQAEDLRQFQPDLIVLDFDYQYASLDSLLGLPCPPDKSWTNMVHASYQYAMSTDQYERWMVPFQNSRLSDPLLKRFQHQVEHLISLKNQVLGGVFIEPYPRYHLYLVRKGTDIHASVEKILLEHGAISWHIFKTDVLK